MFVNGTRIFLVLNLLGLSSKKNNSFEMESILGGKGHHVTALSTIFNDNVEEL